MYKSYGHFDDKKDPKKWRKYIENPENIERHAFLPFILDKRKIIKYNKEKGRLKKTRDIYYSAHLDRYIYQWYNHKLNSYYNKYAVENDIDECVVAYREKIKGMTNIEISKYVFMYILEQKDAIIMVGDFKSFFDKLDHEYLKSMICKVMKIDNGILPKDYYNIYKSITKYAYFDMNNIIKTTQKSKSEIYKAKRIFNIDEFRKNKRLCLKINKDNYGIPQGSSISSVLSNIYMLEADKAINKIVQKYNGIYRRYSDDFLMILPNISESLFKTIYQEVINILKNNGNPILEDKKTQIYKYNNNSLKNITKYFIESETIGKNEIDYLGFSFDGKNVRIRDKSISKYYYRMTSKAKTIKRNGGYILKGNEKVKISMRNLYELYSDNGDRNFVSYTKRVEKAYRNTNIFISPRKKFFEKIKQRLK